MKLGIAVNNLGPSQANFQLIRNANKLLDEMGNLDIIVFYENAVRACVSPEFATMQMTECWGFDGPVIATSYSTAEKLLKCPCPSRKVYYIWDLEWLRQRRHFNEHRSVYGNPSLLLIARSLSHSQVVAQAWNRPVSAVVEDFDMSRLLELAHG